VLNQQFSLLVATSYTQAGDPAVRAESFANGPIVQAPTPFATATDPSMSAWFGFLPNSCTDETFASSMQCPVSLRLWRTGTGNATGLVRPTYRIGVYAPATYTPDVAPNGAGGAYDPTTSVITWLSSPITDSGTWLGMAEQTLTLGPQVIDPATYQRGQVLIYVTMPHSTSGAGIQIFGYGFRG
jgi:hypothetical protein